VRRVIRLPPTPRPRTALLHRPREPEQDSNEKYPAASRITPYACMTNSEATGSHQLTMPWQLPRLLWD